MATVSVFASDIQKWTDANGRIHYGDEPPPGVAAKHVAIENAAQIQPDAEVQVAETIVRSFGVSGTTARELEASGASNGPVDPSTGRHVWGMTHWNLEWKFKYSNEGGMCKIGAFSLTVDATMDFPSWTDRNAASEVLKNKWDGFARILRAHEDGHKENGIKAANDLANRLRALPPEGDCAALDRRIEALGRRITSEYRYLDQAYDRATNHGVNQGATLF